MTEELKKHLHQFLMVCAEKPRYKALYGVATYSDLLDAVHDAVAWIDSSGVAREAINGRIRNSKHGLLIEFKNGSWIRVIAAKENMRAIRCNEYAVAPDVSPEIREVLFDPMVIDYEQQERWLEERSKNV